MIVLDTHAWAWWIGSRQKVGKSARLAIEKADRIGIPAISIWEIAIKAEARQWKFDQPYDEWVEQGLNLDRRFELLPLSPAISIGAVRLSWNHGDPADRFIVATARVHDASLVTSDERIHESKLVHCIWD